MPKIKLFSGMDFSGKTTIINGINSKIPNTFKIKKKFLTSIDLIENVRKMDTWLSPEEWKPLLQKNIQMDIDNYKVDKIINVGAAAAVNDLLNIGDVVIGKYIVQHDFDITAFGHSKGYITGVGNGVECNNNIIESIKKAVNSIRNIDFKVKLGTVATGDIFCTDVAMKDKISAKFDADVVDMECGAVAQVAYLSGIPFGAIRGVSDTPNGKNAEDFDKNLDKAADICKKVLEKTIDNL